MGYATVWNFGAARDHHSKSPDTPLNRHKSNHYKLVYYNLHRNMVTAAKREGKILNGQWTPATLTLFLN